MTRVMASQYSLSAVEKIKPRLWMFENVRGMFYRNKKYLGEIINTLESLGSEISFQIVKAVDYQVPQNRERLVVIGHKGSFDFPPTHDRKYTAGDAINDIAYLTDSNSKFVNLRVRTHISQDMRKHQSV